MRLQNKKFFCPCGSNKFSKNFNFGNIPIKINEYNKNIGVEKKRVLLTICKDCGLVQLRYTINRNILFSKKYSYQSGDSKQKIKNFNNILCKIKKIKKNKYTKILDIGSNDNSLVNILKKKYINTYGIEPTDIYKKNYLYKSSIFNNFLNYSFIKNKINKYDILIACNLIGHVDNLEEIINCLNLLLKKDGYIIIEVQYLISLIKNYGFDSFHHEHVSYFTLNTLSKILSKFGFIIKEAKVTNIHGGILRVIATKNSKVNINQSVERILKKEKKINILKSIQKINNYRVNFNNKINKLLEILLKKNKIIYGIGAAPRTCVLLNSARIKKKQIKFIAEVENSLKLEHPVPGTEIYVKNEKDLISKKPDFFIIFSWHLSKHLIKNYKKLGYKGKFLIPLPKIVIKN